MQNTGITATELQFSDNDNDIVPNGCLDWRWKQSMNLLGLGEKWIKVANEIERPSKICSKRILFSWREKEKKKHEKRHKQNEKKVGNA